MKMKKILLVFILLFSTYYSFGANKIRETVVVQNEFISKNDLCSNLVSDDLATFLLDVKLLKILNFTENNKGLYDCEVKVKGNFEGTKVDVVVTIYDVSWGGCQTLKLAVKVGLATM